MRHAHEGAGESVRLRIAVLTVSDTRTPETDASGRLTRERVETAGHVVHDYRLVRDEPDSVADAIGGWLADPACDVVITNGGTGIAPRDRTFEVVAGLVDRTLDGFGELFRALSFQEIGSAAMLSRAVGGIARGKVLFALPGSTAAVSLALDRLIVPELRHLADQLRLGRGC